jgi:hypothetical protein
VAKQTQRATETEIEARPQKAAAVVALFIAKK